MSWANDLSLAELSALLGRPVASFTVSSALELEQSRVATLLVAFSDGPAVSILLKRASVAALLAQFPNKSDEAWSINEASFACEVAWARAAPCDALAACGARVPRTLGAAAEPASPPRCYTTAQELLPRSAWRECRRVRGADANAALCWLANYHAYFFTHATARDALVRAGIFTAGGGWWRGVLRPSVRFGDGPAVFEQHCADLPEYAAAGIVAARDVPLVRWAAARARELHARARATPEQPHRTVAHGDFKTSNMFFSSSGCNAAAPAAGVPVVAAFDFQWASTAHTGASDVAYLLAGGVEYDELVGGGAERLLGVYAAELARALRSHGADEGMVARECGVLVAALDEELLIFYTCALPYLLRDLTPARVAANAAKYGWLTCEDDARVTAWLAARALATLRTWRDNPARCPLEGPPPTADGS